MSNRLLLGRALASVLTIAIAAPASAALNLANYQVSLQRGIDFDEASGIAYNYDKNVLFVIDDEGDDAAEYSLAGNRLTADKFQTNYRDLEGVTYVGGGRYVLANERTEEMVRVGPLSTSNGAVPSTLYNGPATAQIYQVNGGANVGNNGLEGVAFDPTTGGYFGVKQGGVQNGNQIAEKVYFTQVSFGNPTTGMTTLAFDPTPLGLGTLSDIAVLASNPNFANTDYYGNLLLLSADPATRRLLEVSRTGQLLSSFDLSALDIQTIEGVTIDRRGNIYLVGETGGTSANGSTSGLVVLSRVQAAVPESSTWAMMIAGFGLVGGATRRRGAAALAV